VGVIVASKLSASTTLSRSGNTLTNQIPFRYRAVDSASGVARNTAKQLSAHLG